MILILSHPTLAYTARFIHLQAYFFLLWQIPRFVYQSQFWNIGHTLVKRLKELSPSKIPKFLAAAYKPNVTQKITVSLLYSVSNLENHNLLPLGNRDIKHTHTHTHEKVLTLSLKPYSWNKERLHKITWFSKRDECKSPTWDKWSPRTRVMKITCLLKKQNPP